MYSIVDAEPDEPPPFAELYCRSNFTFLTGAAQPEDLVERAAAKLYSALALTDECTVSGVVRGHLSARENGLHFIVGSEILLTTAGGTSFARVVFLAQDRLGYGNLCELITLARTRAPKGSYLAHVADVEGKTSKATHLVGMAGCLALVLPDREVTVEALFAQCMWARTWFPDRAWVLAPRTLASGEDLYLWTIEQAANRSGIRVAATCSPLMHTRFAKPILDTLTAVRHGCTVADAGLRRYPNGQNYLRGRAMLEQEFPEEWLLETVAIAGRCTFSLEELRYEYPEEIVPAGETPASHLRKLTYAGAERRFPQGLPDKVRDQIEHELGIIAQLKYEAYFLTVEDIVRFAREAGILCQGRGSAANSAVCYCLFVTEVDPGRMNVLFERFISVERREPPDIDIDF